jgi:hypothetical protein
MGTGGSETAAARSWAFFWRMPVKSSEDTTAAATKKAATEAIKIFSFNTSFPRRFLLFRGGLFAFPARGFVFFPADFTLFMLSAQSFSFHKKNRPGEPGGGTHRNGRIKLLEESYIASI